MSQDGAREIQRVDVVDGLERADRRAAGAGVRVGARLRIQTSECSTGPRGSGASASTPALSRNLAIASRALQDGHAERRDAVAGGRAHVGAGVEEQLDQIGAIALRGPMQAVDPSASAALTSAPRATSARAAGRPAASSTTAHHTWATPAVLLGIAIGSGFRIILPAGFLPGIFGGTSGRTGTGHGPRHRLVTRRARRRQPKDQPRGGGRSDHTDALLEFPLDGDYLAQIELAGFAREPHQLEVAVDGARRALLTIGEPEPGGRGGRGGRHDLGPGIRLPADPHVIGVTFIEHAAALDEGTLLPRPRTRGRCRPWPA
jgi:hypothetical protein